MNTAGHERALQGLIKGGGHGIFTKYRGKQGWKRGQERKKIERRYLEINLQVPLLSHVLNGGVILSCALILGFLVGKNTEDLCSPCYMGNNLCVYQNEML